MAIVNIHWNLVKCVQAANLETLAKDSAISYHPNVEPSCRGVYFRSILTEELDFSETLKGLKFEDVRRQRQDGGNKLLFTPKPTNERSIGVLRVMKPKRFNSPKGINVTADSVNMVSRSKDYDVLLETTEFILEDAQEQMQERFQLQETFGDFNVFFFGKRAEIFTYSGSLLNGCKDLQWRSQFLANYEKYLRGTRCVELKARVYFLYDDIIREGFILAASLGQNSTVDGVVKFTFTMLITDKRTMGYIPENVEAKPLTLDRSGETKNGITEFRFFRSTDPNLPLVASKFEVGENGEPIVIDNSVFVPDESLPGDNPPEDLRVQMQNLTLKALSELGGGQDVVKISDESLDSDILLEFIHGNKLGYNTQLLASGKKSLDVENLGGDELVLLLTSSPPGKTLDSLQLRQAVDVALSFSGTNSALISADVASELGTLSGYFAINSTARVQGPTTPTTDYASLLANKESYILQKSQDQRLLTDVIVDAKPIVDMKEDVLAAAASATTKASSASAYLLADSGEIANSLPLLELYMAALALMKHPLSQNQLPSFSQLDGSVSTNSIDYVRSQKLSKYVAALQTLPGEFEAALTAAAANFTACQLASLLVTHFPGLSIENIPLSEWTLKEATEGPGFMSQESARFLIQSSVYITGIVSEQKKSIGRTSLDVLGATVLDAKDIEAAKVKYFTQAYADSLKAEPAGSVIASVLVDVRAIGPVSNGVGGVAPDGSHYLLFPTGALTANEILFQPIGIVPSSPPNRLISAGYPRIPSSKLTEFVSGGGTATSRGFLSNARIRKPGVAKLPGAPTVPITQTSYQNFTEGLGELHNAPLSLAPHSVISSVVMVKKFPVPRGYIGSAQNDYLPPTLANIRDISVTKIGELVKSSSKAMEQAVSKSILSFAENGIPDSVNDEPIRAELAIANLTSDPSIKELSDKLATLGAVVGDFIDMLAVAEREREMATKLSRLRSLLDSAIKAAQGDSAAGGKGANVKDSDAATKNAICHAK